MMEIIAPKVGGVTLDDGSVVPAQYMIDGGPSVLFDAVALLLTEEGANRLIRESAAKDFVSDAFAHCKFIAHSDGAAPLLLAAGVEPAADEGVVGLDAANADDFVVLCRSLRLWAREMATKL